MKITLLCDNPRSWILPYAKKLKRRLMSRGHRVALVHQASFIKRGDVAVYLACEHFVPAKVRARNARNLVVHESALPKGKGWSPLTWQILEGKREVPITLFEATDRIDAGEIYAQRKLRFRGDELVDELRHAQGEATIALVERFMRAYPMKGKAQKGKATFYRRRSPVDSELDPRASLVENFDLLRVVDNERYPAFFRHKGRTYILKIYKKD